MSFSNAIKHNKPTRKLEKIFLFSHFLIVALLVSGCSGDTDSKNGAFNGREVSDARKVQVKNNVGIDDLRDVAESDAQQTVNSSGVRTINGQFLDLKTNRLFDESIRDDDDRFNRVEFAVQDIRDDFDKMVPAINRLISIESDIKELHKQLSILVDDGSLDDDSANLTNNEPAPRKIYKTASGKKLNVDLPVAERPKPIVKTTPLAPKTISSLQISVGDHSDKTRVVFETPNKENFDINFDSENQLVTINASENIPVSILKSAVGKSKMILEGSHDLQNADKNTIIFLTKNIQSISKGSYIAPTAQKNYHRYYFDLFY